MSNYDELVKLMSPVLRTLLPEKERSKYENLPFTLWGGLFTKELGTKRYERRMKEYVKFLLRADQVGWMNAINTVDKLVNAPHSNFNRMRGVEWFWTKTFNEVYRGQMPKRDAHTRLCFEAKMRDIDLIEYLLGHLTGSSTQSSVYYQRLLDEDDDLWEYARVATAVRTYLYLWDWWQVEGIDFKKRYPSFEDFRDVIQPVRFHILGSGALSLG